jgi:hypothetical protein
MELLASFFLLILASGLAEQTNRYILTILRRSSMRHGAPGLLLPLAPGIRLGRADQQVHPYYPEEE